jgi:hypothetical protein
MSRLRSSERYQTSQCFRLSSENMGSSRKTLVLNALSKRSAMQHEITGEAYHDPPPASELPDRLRAICAFANGETPNHLVHPAVRAIILYFWLAYDHPFVEPDFNHRRHALIAHAVRNPDNRYCGGAQDKPQNSNPTASEPTKLDNNCLQMSALRKLLLIMILQLTKQRK